MPAESHEAFSQVFTIRYDECGAGGTARASVHLRLLQELAFAHSAALGFPVAWYDRRRLYWLVRRVHLVVEAPVGHGDALVYVTRIAGARRILARRLNTVRRADDGSPVTSALVDWILTAGGAAPARIPDAMAQAFPQFAKPIVPVALEERRPPPEAAWSSLWIRSSDADPMGHANNAVYLDLLDDAVARAGGLRAVDAHPRTYDLLYHAAAAAGEPLSDVAWFDGCAVALPAGATRRHAPPARPSCRRRCGDLRRRKGCPLGQYVNIRSCSTARRTSADGMANSAGLPARSASEIPRALPDMPDR